MDAAIPFSWHRFHFPGIIDLPIVCCSSMLPHAYSIPPIGVADCLSVNSSFTLYLHLTILESPILSSTAVYYLILL